jgi:hypothetical protein
MQTFFPHNNLVMNAQALDNKRLNKQILEGYQILKVLSNRSESGAWRNHPAVLMWKGAEYSLRTYINAMIVEAKHRGIKTDKNEENINILEDLCSEIWGTKIPDWFSGEEQKRINATHKANLYIKDPIYYVEFKPALEDKYNVPCCEGCKYYWTTHLTNPPKKSRIKLKVRG